MLQDNIHKQKLDVIVILQNEDEAARRGDITARLPFWRKLLELASSSIQAAVAWGLGSFWRTAVAASVASGLYVAAAYLVLLPLNGLAVTYTHGGPPRKLLDERMTEYKRVVVATSSLNGSDWWVFYGGSLTVNSLLNKPLNRAGGSSSSSSNYSRSTRRGQFIVALLQLCIVSQWGLAVGFCALQDWNAIIVSAWRLTFCASSSAYLYPARQCVRDWLELDCNIRVQKITAEFSSRRSMLGAHGVSESRHEDAACFDELGEPHPLALR